MTWDLSKWTPLHQNTISRGANVYIISIFGYLAGPDTDEFPGGSLCTWVKTYVYMHVRKVLKCTHFSEIHDGRITPFSEPFPG